jgi:hypothetical protein
MRRTGLSLSGSSHALPCSQHEHKLTDMLVRLHEGVRIERSNDGELAMDNLLDHAAFPARPPSESPMKVRADQNSGTESFPSWVPAIQCIRF